MNVLLVFSESLSAGRIARFGMQLVMVRDAIKSLAAASGDRWLSG
jgi:hypothetical protein